MVSNTPTMANFSARLQPERDTFGLQHFIGKRKHTCCWQCRNTANQLSWVLNPIFYRGFFIRTHKLHSYTCNYIYIYIPSDAGLLPSTNKLSPNPRTRVIFYIYTIYIYHTTMSTPSWQLVQSVLPVLREKPLA